MIRAKAVSPASTGGAGTLFEYRVAAIVLSHLLAGTHLPGLAVPVVDVALQQRPLGHLLDDIVVFGEPGPSPLSTEFQVKRTLTVTGSDGEFVAVVTQALLTLAERGDEVHLGDLRLGLVASGEAKALGELTTLTDLARAHVTHKTFNALMQPNVIDQKVRSRWDHVRAAVSAAIVSGAPDLGGVDLSTHAVLSVLHVWQVADSDDGDEQKAALNRLSATADAFGVTAVSLFADLVMLAQSWGPLAGVVNANHVRRELRRRGLRYTAQAGQHDDALVAEDIDADAVVRGPINAIGQADALREAEQLLASGDPAAADRFGAIAQKLESAGYWPHAALMRRREADGLQAAGDPDEAVLRRVGLAWDHLDAAQPWPAGFALHDGEQPGVDVHIGEVAARVKSAAVAATWVAKGGDLDRFVPAFDALEDNDPHVARAATFLCEEAIAADRPDVVLNRLNRLENIAGAVSAETPTVDRPCGARIQMCVADATGSWAPLLPAINRRYARPVVAWVHARYARHLALSGDGATAQQEYLHAIERACIEKMFDEAADWEYALRTVRFWYVDSLEDEQHPMAEALRPHARPSRLPGAPHTAENALRSARDTGRPAEARQQVRRWRWQAVVRGQLAEEIEAVDTLGELLQRDGDAEDAIKCFIRSGSEKEAAAAAQHLPDAEAHIDVATLNPVEFKRAAAFAAVAAAADLLSDDHAQEWGDEALAEVSRTDRVPRFFGPSAYLRAYDALAALCDGLSGDQLDRLLEQIEPLIDRPAGQYRKTDEAVANILLSAVGRRPDLAPMLARALLADQQMAEPILRRANLLRRHKDAIEPVLAPHAADNQLACVALILAGADPAPAIAYAQARVNQELTPRDHQPGRTTLYAGAVDTALLASVLDQNTRDRFAHTMLERALDRRELTASRRNDITGLINIARTLSDDTKAALLPSIMEIARGEDDGGPADDLFSGDNPRSSVRFVGPSSLADLALVCASRLTTDPALAVEIESAGISLLLSADEHAQWQIGHAIAVLPSAKSELNLSHCAAHPTPALRALAAVRWAKDPTVLPTATAAALARDNNKRVRRELANAIFDHRNSASAGQTSPVVTILASDARRSIRRLVR